MIPNEESKENQNYSIYWFLLIRYFFDSDTSKKQCLIIKKRGATYDWLGKNSNESLRLV